MHEILAFISDEAPCGVDIREDAGRQNLYYELKDARNQARSTERSAAPGEPLRVSAAWSEVDRLASGLLADATKDIELLAWLAEAQLRLAGFGGLRKVFEVTAQLVEDHWDDLHSVDTQNMDDKVAPLAGLNGISSEGTLIQPIRLTSLVPDDMFGRHNLWEYQLSQRAEETELRDALNDAVASAGGAAMAAHLAELQGCIAAFDRLDRALTERCAEHAPPASNIRGALGEAAAAIRILAGLSAEEEDAGPAPAQPLVPDKAAAPSTGINGWVRGEITSREEALDTLLSVARYFRRSEPHSPMSLSIETLVRRARMDFSELLAELLPEQHARNGVLVAAGIQPKVEKNGE